MRKYLLPLILISLLGLSFVSCILEDDETGDLIYRYDNESSEVIRIVRFSHEGSTAKWDSIHLHPNIIFEHTGDYYVGNNYIEYNKLYDSIHIHYDDSYLVRHYSDNRNSLARPIFDYYSWDFSKEIINNGLSDRIFLYNFTNKDFDEAKIKGTKY